MKRLFALLSIAAILSFAGILARGSSPEGIALACTHTTYGTAAYSSYHNYATGQTAYIGFQAVKQNDCSSTFWGYIYVWSTDGYPISGVVFTRIWVDGYYDGATSCGVSGNSYGCYTKYGYGGTNSSSSVDDCCSTNVYDDFGGAHSKYVKV